MFKRFPAAFLLFLSVGFCFAQTETPVILDTRPSWTVGISAFSIKAEAEELRYLSVSLPLLLYDKLAELQVHTYTPEEAETYRAFVLDQRITKAEKDLADIYVRQDALLLSGGDREAQYDKLSEEAVKLEKQLQAIRTMDGSPIAVPLEKPIRFLYADEGRLLPAPVQTPVVFMNLKEMDFYIAGYIEEVEGWVYIEVKGYAAGFQDPVFVYANAGALDTAEGKIAEAALDLKTAVYGKEWGAAIVSVNEEKSSVYVDGKFVGSGGELRIFLPAGEHELRVEATGYEDLTSAFALTHKEEKLLSLTLTATSPFLRLVTSFPSGADARLSSRWQGVTPLLLSAETDPVQVLLSKDGFAPGQVILSRKSPLLTQSFLPPSFLDRENLVKKKQDRFYLSAGFLILSIPIPILMYSLANDLSVAFNNAIPAGNAGELDRLYKSISVCYDGYVCGLVLAGTLFVHSLVRLVDYIIAREGSS